MKLESRLSRLEKLQPQEAEPLAMLFTIASPNGEKRLSRIKHFFPERMLFERNERESEEAFKKRAGIGNGEREL